jgi:hypothetical protein
MNNQHFFSTICVSQLFVCTICRGEYFQKRDIRPRRMSEVISGFALGVVPFRCTRSQVWIFTCLIRRPYKKVLVQMLGMNLVCALIKFFMYLWVLSFICVWFSSFGIVRICFWKKLTLHFSALCTMLWFWNFQSQCVCFDDSRSGDNLISRLLIKEMKVNGSYRCRTNTFEGKDHFQDTDLQLRRMFFIHSFCSSHRRHCSLCLFAEQQKSFFLLLTRLIFIYKKIIFSFRLEAV